jgi:hypothetical protein
MRPLPATGRGACMRRVVHKRTRGAQAQLATMHCETDVDAVLARFATDRSERELWVGRQGTVVATSTYGTEMHACRPARLATAHKMSSS